jgi:alpha-glucosidase
MKKHVGHFLLITLVLAAMITGCSNRISTASINSPSGMISASVYADSSHKLTYRVEYNGKTIVAPSTLGITIDQQDLGQGVEIGSPAFVLTDEKYPWKGVHALAVNHYREAIIPVRHLASGIHYQLEIKAFDDGIAFRYVVPAKGISLVGGEASSWKIPEGSTVWYQENIFYYEGLYYASTLSKLGTKRMGPPLTYETPDSIYVSITEAAL